MIVLGIETSCDETSASIVKDGKHILSNVVVSQIKIHEEFGGVVPELASRDHIKNILPVVSLAIEKANITEKDIDKIAVTYAPGLVGSLLVGISFAKSYAYALGLPLTAVHHLYGHICANFIEHEVTFPLLALVVSGGHTAIYHMTNHTSIEQLATTRDDACGEVYDKIARELGLGYPGGPTIDKLSKQGNPNAIPFPYPKFKDGNPLDFSYSGLKTAVLEYYRKNPNVKKEDLLASFQKTAIDLLFQNTYIVLKSKKIDTLILSGGVACNSYLRQKFDTLKQENYKIFYPSPPLCTDNAAIIACAGYFLPTLSNEEKLTLNAVPNLLLKM